MGGGGKAEEEPSFIGVVVQHLRQMRDGGEGPAKYREKARHVLVDAAETLGSPTLLLLRIDRYKSSGAQQAVVIVTFVRFGVECSVLE